MIKQIGRYEDSEVFVSTILASDTRTFETAIGHAAYNDKKLIIVETYDTESGAIAGHEKWLSAMTTGALPDKLIDLSKTWTSHLLDMVESPAWRVYLIDPQWKK